MMSAKNFTKDWIYNICKSLKRGRNIADPALVEKVINALYLLERIAKTDLEFIFKGGTALLLLLNKIHRFSMDIDIIVKEKKSGNSLNKIFSDAIRSNNIFYEFEEVRRFSSKNIPKAHYKFYYRSILDDRSSYILLDIVFESNPYTELIEKDIVCELILIEGETIKVTIPSVDCMLGDKLTAFAPNTTGIPYGVNKELEIIKQLFDIGNLFDEVNNLKAVRDTFINVSKKELEYRESTVANIEDVFDDIINTSIIIAYRGGIKNDEFNQLVEGVKRIRGYIFSKNFIIEEAVLSSAKAAYLALLLKNEICSIEFFNNKKDIMSMDISDDRFRKSFRSIKKFSPEGYYYWYKFLELYSQKNI